MNIPLATATIIRPHATKTQSTMWPRAWMLAFFIVALAPTTQAAGRDDLFVLLGPSEWSFQFDLSSPETTAAIALRLDTDHDGAVSDAEREAIGLDLPPRDVPARCASEPAFASADGRSPVRVTHVWRHAGGPGVASGISGLYFHVGLAFDGEPGSVELNLRELGRLEALLTCVHGGPVLSLLQDHRPDRVRILGYEDAWIEASSVRPSSLRKELGVHEFSSPDSNETARSNMLELEGAALSRAYAEPVRFRLRPEPEPNDALWVAGAALAAVSLRLTLSEIGRFRVAQLLASIPLFSRITKNRVLDHRTREAIVDFINASPGSSMSEVRRGLDLGHGTTIHHVRVLRAQGLVWTARDGLKCRIYPAQARLPTTRPISELQTKVLESLRAQPGMTQAQLAKALGLPRKNVAYHVSILRSLGLVRLQKLGRAVLHYPA